MNFVANLEKMYDWIVEENRCVTLFFASLAAVELCADIPALCTVSSVNRALHTTSLQMI